MAQKAPAHARHARRNGIRPGFVVGMLALALCITVAAVAIAYAWSQNLGALEAAEQAYSAVRSAAGLDEPQASEPAPAAPPAANDKPASSAMAASGMQADASMPTSSNAGYQPMPVLPTPVIAEYDGILVHSPIEASRVYAILFHQASYPWSLPMTTKLPELDADVVFETHDIDIPERQPTGDAYMDAGALHVWRIGEATEMDTSVDVGAAAGTTVYAPVSGTVVLVAPYSLYDVCADYEIHIQPDGRPDLDGVCLHVSNVAVKAGDEVEAGVTPLAKVRDIAAQGVDGIHLADFSDEENGNHCHFQFNDVTYDGYREAKLKDAIEVG